MRVRAEVAGGELGGHAAGQVKDADGIRSLPSRHDGARAAWVDGDRIRVATQVVAPGGEARQESSGAQVEKGYSGSVGTRTHDGDLSIRSDVNIMRVRAEV